MVETDELEKLAQAMGQLDGPSAGTDELDELLSLEAQWNEEGRRDGIRDGTKQGAHEGRILGVQKGHELGAELGYYAGCAAAWLAAHSAAQGDGQSGAAVPKVGGDEASTRQHQAAVGMSERARKSLLSVVKLVEEFPLDDVASEKLSEAIDQVRAKWKAAVSQMGLTMQQERPAGILF
mmetsp:Transcript_3374/g.8557  ORF Transcript_3374/g.8557 Transcript_3374/m.8557 type:complete len:179 (-) Transcript_3374:240-776(-)